jgi:hypothetical protein
MEKINPECGARKKVLKGKFNPTETGSGLQIGNGQGASDGEHTRPYAQ